MTNIKMKKKNKKIATHQKQLTNNSDVLLHHAREDWENLQKGAKKEKLLRYAKESGVMTAKTLLFLIALGGIVTVAVIAPNVFSVIGKSMKNSNFISKQDFYKNKRYLIKRGLLKSERKKNNTYILTLTSSGATIVLKNAYNQLSISKQKTWDKKWRIILFDIPEKHKSEREILREKLRSLGFYQLQRSVFAHPYPCFEEIKCVVSILNISSYVKFLETSSLINDNDIKIFFRLA